MSGTGKTILVTGGGGYIGSHCIVELLKEDFDVIVVDNFVNCIKGTTILSFYFIGHLLSVTV
jgi:UDP-glucose 4-epimerase